MLVKNLKPQPKIAEYVDRILVFEHTEVLKPFVLPLYANGVPSLLFTSCKGTFGNKDSQHLTLFGQTILPDCVSLNDNFTLIAYFFKPYALLPLFNVSAKELTDQPLNAELIHAQTGRTLREKLVNASGYEEMMSNIDDHIFQLILKTKKPELTSVKFASLKLAADTSKESLIKIQKELNLTERSLQRLFEKNIGLSPNLYRRICQFNAAFVQLNQRKFTTLSDIAYQHGYADQSHYIRSFKEFTSITPGDYFKFGA